VRARAGRLSRTWATLALLGAAFAYGVAVGVYGLFPCGLLRELRRAAGAERTPAERSPPGRWHQARAATDAGAQGAAESLSAVGYLGAYAPARGPGGATTFDPARVEEGWTLFTSGHAPGAYLVAASGELVHEWEIDFDRAWPEGVPFPVWEDHRHFLRRAHVFPNGDLLAVFEYVGMVKLDGDSRVLWRRAGRNHHDFDVAADGRIVTLVRHPLTAGEMAARYPGFETPAEGILDDELVFLDPAGEELQRVSLFEAFQRSEYAPFLGPGTDTSDVFHSNSVDLVESEQAGPLFAAGEVLVSSRSLNAVFAVDVEERRVTWLLTGKWRGQHQAQLLANGNLLLLDNRGGNHVAPPRSDRSEVLELDPLTQRVVWSFGGTEREPLFTHWLGCVQRLPNGNTLVTESSQGRILEVTPEGRIAWEYVNPHRAGDEGGLIATIMGARRIGPEELEFLSPERRP